MIAVRRAAPERHRRTAAARARKARARRRQGQAIFYIEGHEQRLVGGLLQAGRLTEAEALERPSVERELGRVLDDWARRWLQK
jgi:hypothetical protein